MKTERDKKPIGDKSEDSREWFMEFKERSYLYNIKVQGEAESANADAVASYSEEDRGWDGWMASPAQWAWIWASSRRW